MDEFHRGENTQHSESGYEKKIAIFADFIFKSGQDVIVLRLNHNLLC